MKSSSLFILCIMTLGNWSPAFALEDSKCTYTEETDVEVTPGGEIIVIPRERPICEEDEEEDESLPDPTIPTTGVPGDGDSGSADPSNRCENPYYWNSELGQCVRNCLGGQVWDISKQTCVTQVDCSKYTNLIQKAGIAPDPASAISKAVAAQHTKFVMIGESHNDLYAHTKYSSIIASLAKDGFNCLAVELPVGAGIENVRYAIEHNDPSVLKNVCDQLGTCTAETQRYYDNLFAMVTMATYMGVKTHAVDMPYNIAIASLFDPLTVQERNLVMASRIDNLIKSRTCTSVVMLNGFGHSQNVIHGRNIISLPEALVAKDGSYLTSVIEYVSASTAAHPFVQIIPRECKSAVNSLLAGSAVVLTGADAKMLMDESKPARDDMEDSSFRNGNYFKKTDPILVIFGDK